MSISSYCRRWLCPCAHAEVNGTLKVGSVSYQWNDEHGRYLDTAYETAFGGNWTQLDDDCYTAHNKVRWTLQRLSAFNLYCWRPSCFHTIFETWPCVHTYVLLHTPAPETVMKLFCAFLLIPSIWYYCIDSSSSSSSSFICIKN